MIRHHGLVVAILVVIGSLLLTLAASKLAPLPGARPPAHTQTSDEPTTTIEWEGSHGDRVLVLGHEFARTWFRYWGGSPRRPVGKGGLTLAFGDLDEDPKGRAAMNKHVSESPGGTVVFFMMGPESLEGGSEKAAGASVERLLAEVDDVAKAASAQGRKLVVGGPLPSLPSDTDRPLVDAHRAYAKALRERERDGRLRVFDAYEHMSTAGQVTLVRGYAYTPAESRLGAAGYDALDEVFFPFMQERF